MLRKLLQFHDRSRVEGSHRIESGDVGSCRPSAGIDENIVGCQRPRAARIELYLDGVGTGKVRVAENQLDVFGIFQTMLHSCTKVFNNCLRTRANLRHVNANRPTMNAIVGGAPGQVGCVRAGNHTLRRRAASIDAGAADMFSFDNGGPATGTAQVEGQRFSRLTSTDDNRAKVLRCHTMPTRYGRA